MKVASLVVRLAMVLVCCFSSTVAADSSLRRAEAEAVRFSEQMDPGYLRLEDCLRRALESNVRILEAEELIQEQLGTELRAKSILFPKLRALASYNRVDPDSLPTFGDGNFGADQGWQGDIELEQPLFLGGRGMAERKRESLRTEAARFALLGVVNQVLYEVKTRFFNVLLAKTQVAVREEAVQLLQQELSAEKNRLEAGTVSQFNVLRAEVELANAQTPLIQARNEYRISLEELARILASKPRDPGAIAPALKIQGDLQFEEPELNLAGAISQARKNRPEVKRLRLLIEANEQGIDLARAGYLPELSAYAGYTGESFPFDNDLTDVLHGWKLGVRLNWDIFDGGDTIGRMKEAKSVKKQVEIALRQQQLNIDIEVRRALSRLVEARELVYASRKVVKRAEESLRLARARLEAGSGRQLDVLDTRVSLTEAQTNEVESRHSFNVAKAELERAIGKLAPRTSDNLD